MKGKHLKFTTEQSRVCASFHLQNWGNDVTSHEVFVTTECIKSVHIQIKIAPAVHNRLSGSTPAPTVFMSLWQAWLVMCIFIKSPVLYRPKNWMVAPDREDESF